jgi:hypothetical protein
MAQQLQNITVAAPGFFGLNTMDSPIGLSPNFAATADNCVIDQYGRVGARKGWTAVSTNGSSVLGSSRGIETIFEFVDKSGDKVVLSAGNNKIFKGTSTLTDITPSGYTPTGNNWKVVNFNDHVYMFQIGHEPLIGTDHSGSFVLEAMSSHSHATGTAPQGNEVLAAYGRLWVADITGNKHTVYWSDFLNGHAWSGGSTGSLDVTEVWPSGYDEIVSLAAHNGFLIIFGKKSILVYSGADDTVTAGVFKLEDTIKGVGCIARDSVQHTGTDIIFLSDSGVRSFGRTIQEKSMPMRDISKNVRNDINKAILSQTNPIKSVYSEDEAFYLLSFSESHLVYCFDMRGPLDESGAHRVTTWTALDPLCFTVLDDGSIYMGKDSGIVKYSGYADGTASYQLSYFSNPLDFGNAANLKFLKKFNLTLISSPATPVTLNWGYDYTDSYTKQAFSFSGTTANIAEYGVSEYNTTAEYTSGTSIQTPRVNASGSGEVVAIGLEAQINNAEFSIQKIDIHALLGRLI